MKMFYSRKGEPIEFMELAELLQDPSYRNVGRNNFDDGSFLSTVWVGMNLHHTNKEIFETMYFPENGNPVLIGRWTTEEDAYEHHEKALNELASQHNPVL